MVAWRLSTCNASARVRQRTKGEYARVLCATKCHTFMCTDAHKHTHTALARTFNGTKTTRTYLDRPVVLNLLASLIRRVVIRVEFATQLVAHALKMLRHVLPLAGLAGGDLFALRLHHRHLLGEEVAGPGAAFGLHLRHIGLGAREHGVHEGGVRALVALNVLARRNLLGECVRVVVAALLVHLQVIELRLIHRLLELREDGAVVLFLLLLHLRGHVTLVCNLLLQRLGVIGVVHRAAGQQRAPLDEDAAVHVTSRQSCGRLRRLALRGCCNDRGGRRGLRAITRGGFALNHGFGLAARFGNIRRCHRLRHLRHLEGIALGARTDGAAVGEGRQAV
eukprot:Opistho-1_new@45723